MYSSEDLNFAYGYPFTDIAKQIISSLNLTSIDFKYLELGKERAISDIKGDLPYYDILIDSIKLDEIISYAYAKMMVMALKRPDYVEKFSVSESKRALQAMEKDSEQDIFKLSSSLGITLHKDQNDNFLIKFNVYLHNIPNDPFFALSNQQLHNGLVIISFNKLKRLLERASYNTIKESFNYEEKVKLPKEVMDYSKGIRDETKVVIKGKNNTAWIEKLLETPITDVRHRTVNLILAPYLVNIKGLSVDDAFKVITDYIEKCKTVNPDTKINETYIRYQIEYAKSKGTKPLKFSNAKELLSGLIDFDVRAESESKDSDKDKTKKGKNKQGKSE